jgi:hypothetical protein
MRRRGLGLHVEKKSVETAEPMHGLDTLPMEVNLSF